MLALRGHDLDVADAVVGIKSKRAEGFQMGAPTPMLQGGVRLLPFGGKRPSPCSIGFTQETHHGAQGDSHPPRASEEG
eukprot:15443759-Alexandrium_andersonii.AAC.1